MGILKEQEVLGYLRSLIPWQKNNPFTDERIKDAQNDIDRWEAVEKVVRSPGWQILIDYFQSQLQEDDSISDMKKTPELDDFLYRQGLTKGFKWFLQSPRRLKEKATSAAEFLKAAELASNKE